MNNKYAENMKLRSTIKPLSIILMLFFASFLWNGSKIYSQNNMGIGTLTPDPSALLQIDNNLQNMGLLVPRMNTAQRDAIPSPANALLIYNTECNVFNYYQFDHWVSISGLNIGGGTILGQTNPCQLQAGVVYSIPSVPGSVTYTWTVPPGATITSNTGDSITVDFGSSSGAVCVKATNTCGDMDSLCLVVNLATAAIAPTALPPSDFTCTSFYANWAPVINTTNYLVDVSTDASFASFLPGYNNLSVAGNVTTAQVTGTTQGSLYYYRLRVVNGCDTSTYSNSIIVSTDAPIAPTATDPSNFTCTSFNANWGASVGASFYLLDIATDAAFTTLLPGYAALDVSNVTTYNISGLTVNTYYYYRVRAGNLCDTSGYSNTISIGTVPPIAPTATDANNYTCTSFQANWGSVFGASVYYVDVATDAAFTGILPGYNNFAVIGSTFLNISGLTVNSTYYYRITADNGCSVSQFSNTIIVSTFPPVAPTATEASNYTCTSVTANWGSVAGAANYHLDVSTDANFSTYLVGYQDTMLANITSFNITGLTINTTYYYRVRANNGCSISPNSNTITFGTTAPVAPTATSPDNFTCTSVNVNWGAVFSAIQYFVDVSTDAAFGTFVTGYNNAPVIGGSTTLNITGLIANTTYYYRVRADNGCSISNNSNTITFGTTAPVAPTATPADSYTCTSVNANWGSVLGATQYFLDVSTSSNFSDYVTGYQNLSVANATSFNVTGLTANTTYYYRVRADNGCSISSNSNTIIFGTTAPISPTATPADNFTCTSLSANWGSVPGATQYFLDISTNNQFSTFVNGFNDSLVGNVTTYNVVNLVANTTYYYRVRAGNGCSVSLNSNTISVGTVAPISPTATAASNFTCTSMNANWGAVTGATNYILDVATSTSFGASTLSGYNNLSVANVTTYFITGLTPNVTYHYRVRADNGCSFSAYSNTISIGTAAPISPTATAASNFTCTSFNANWGAVSGAFTYYIDIATTASFGASTLSSYSNFNAGNVTTYNFTGLTANVVYYYRIRADNGCSVSTNSNTIVVGTATPISPTATPADNFTCTSFNANWGAVSGAITYYLDVATNASFGASTLAAYTNFNTGNVTTFNVTSGIVPNVVYYYRLRADNGCSFSLYSNTISAGTTAPISPTATSATNLTCVSFNANWGAVSAALNYFIDVSTDVSFTSFSVLNNQPTANVTTYNVTGLTPGATYYYRVRADNGCLVSLNSNTVSVGTTAPVPPTATPADNFTCTSFNANWGAVTGATNYFLDVSTDVNFVIFSVLNNQTSASATTYNVTGLTPNTTYYYRVRSSNGCLTSINSNTITVGTTAPVPPTATSPDNFTCTSFNANWGAVTGATNYFLDVSTDVNFISFSVLNNQSAAGATTYNVTGLVANTVYYYRVRASNGCSASLNSNTITVATTAPVAPTATDADNFTCTSFNANWGAVTAATSYLIDVSTNANFVGGFILNNQSTGNATTYNVTGLNASTTYYYRVRASNGCSTSLNSNTITIGTVAPVAPSANPADNFTCTSFNANWGAVTGATQYFLDVSTAANFATFQTGYNNLNVGSVSTLNITGLTANIVYYYRVRASNGCAVSLNSNTITIGTVAPIAPAATAADNFTCTSFNANWGAVTGVTQYFLDVSTDASFATFQTGYNNLNVGSATTLNITGLTANITYFYRVRASNGCATSLNSNTITIGTTAPIAPTATAADNFTCTSFNANWGAVTGATQYFLDVSTNASFTTFQTGYNNQNVGNVTTLNITGLTANIVYYYRVRASNGCAVSLNSNTITIGTVAPIAPAATAADNFTCTSFNANWGAVTGAIQYFLDVSTNASFSTFQTGYNNLNVGSATTLNITGLTANITYFYRIRASNGCATSLNSNTITIGTTAPIAPTAVDASNFTCTSFNANWGPVTGSTQYFLDVSTDASFATFQTGYNNLNVGNVTTLNITGLTANITYFYRVRSSNGCATSSNSNFVTVGTTAPVAPAATAADNFTCTSFNANWGAVTGATQYFLDVSTNASFSTFQTGFNNQNLGNVTTYNITGLTANVVYYYRVRASNGCATSLNSNTITIGTVAPLAPTATAADNFTCTSLNANWGATAGAIQYFVDVSTDASFATFQTGYNNLNVGNITTLNITGLTANITYFYRVRASNGCATSLNSNTITIATTSPVAPTAVDATNFTCTSFNANWGAVTGATQYFLDVSTNASFTTYQTGYNNLNVGTTTTWNITGLIVNVNYFYRIRASNGCATSLNSNTILVTTTSPIAPTAVNASNFTCTTFNANWGSVVGATQYFLDVSTNTSFSTFQGGYSNLNVGNVNTLNITGLTANITYYYRLRASNGCSTSLNSNTVTVTTTAPVSPTATPATNFTCLSFNANWGAVTGATSYVIDVSTDASFGTFQTGYNGLNVGNATTLNITGLVANTTYHYRVRATNGCSTSLPSNTISIGTTAPVAPIATSASNFTCTSFNANWGTVTAANTYYLDVSTDANFGTFQAGYTNLNVGNVTTYYVSGLTINTTYYYRLRADNGCSFSANSNTIDVTTTSPIAPITLNADNFSCTTFNANWSASIGASSYLLDVATTGTFTAGTFVLNAFNVGSATTYNVIGLAQNTTYYYRVRAVNGCATSSNSNIIVVTISAPVAPNGIDASNITCTSLNANWGVSSGATGYYLDVSTTTNFAPGSFVTPYNNSFVGNTNTYNIIGLTQGVTYYYRVRAINGCATSVNSNTVSASTTAPSAPVALNGSNFTCTSFNANWSPVLGAVAYYLDVATDAGFTALLTGYNNLNVGVANTYPVTGLAQNANYYYRVRAANICSTSTNSNFTTITTSAPIAPTSSGASNLTCTSFNANWGATVGATTYYLDVATDASFGASTLASYNNLSIGNVTTYNVSGLIVNNTYYYRVRAGNGCSISLNSNSILVVTAAPFAPIAVAPSNLNCTSFNANWGGSVGAILYYLDVSTSATFTNFFGTYSNLNVGNVTSYPISGLTQGITYYYRVRAASGCTTSPNSNTESATIAAPSAPAALPATNVACTSFNANWASVSGAISYIIDASTSASFTDFLTGYNGLNTNGNVTTYNIAAPEIVQGGTYYYRVRAINGCATSGNSNLVSITTAQVNAPIALPASDIACTVFNANWAAVAGATTYLIDVSTSAAFTTTFVTNQNTGNVLTYNVTGLSLNTTYYYRVRAASACATSTNSITQTASTNAPAAPVASAATNVTCTSMNVNWSAVPGIIGYYLDVSTDANFGTYITGYNNLNVGNVTTYNVTGLTGTTVYYRVRSASACSQSINSGTVAVNPSAIAAPTSDAPTGIACAVFNANWIAVTGALSYELDVSTSASFATFLTAYNSINVGNVTTYNVSGLSVNNTYYYRVRSKNACVTSPNSATQVASTNAPSPPTIGLTTNITCTSFNVNWTHSLGAVTYYLDISTDVNFGTFIAGFQNKDVGYSTTYNASPMTGAPPYYFRMRAASGCASGGNSVITMVNPAALPAPVPSAPTGITCSLFNANWQAVTGALSYELDVTTSAGFTGAYVIQAQDVGNNLTYNVTGLLPNNTYYYRVRAKNACVTSVNSSVTQSASTTAPNAPATVVANNVTCASFNARWTAVTGALNYFLDVATDQTFATFLVGYNNLSVGYTSPVNYPVTGLSQNTVYYYRVRALNGCSISGNSDTRIVTTTVPNAPNIQPVTSSSCTSFLAQWSAVAGAVSYQIDVSANDVTFSTMLPSYNSLNVGNTTSVNVTGLSSGILYYFRVRSVNNCGISGSSGIQTFKVENPEIPAPGLHSPGCSTYGAGWPFITSASGYRIDVSDDPSFGSFLSPYNNFSTGNVNTIGLTGLIDPPGEYYFRMRATNACGTSGNSNTLTIITKAPDPPNTNGTQLTNITCNSFVAVWASSVGATTYLLDVSTSSTFATFIYNQLNVGTTLTYSVPALSAGTYYYRVRGNNGCGAPSPSNPVSVILGTPAVPVIAAETNVGASSFTANWNAASTNNATTYYLDVSTDPSFGSGNFIPGYNNKNVGNVTSASVTGLPTGWLNNPKLYYRVRSSNGCGTSLPSATQIVD